MTGSRGEDIDQCIIHCWMYHTPYDVLYIDRTQGFYLLNNRCASQQKLTTFLLAVVLYTCNKTVAYYKLRNMEKGLHHSVTKGVTIVLIIPLVVYMFLFHAVQKTYVNYNTCMMKHGIERLETLGMIGEFTLHTQNIAIIKSN